jgi:hypothetical protein
MLAFVECAQPGALDGRDMNKHVFPAALWLNKAVPLLDVEPLYRTCCHYCLASASESVSPPMRQRRAPCYLAVAGASSAHQGTRSKPPEISTPDRHHSGDRCPRKESREQVMPKYINTALHFEGRAKRAKHAAERDRFMAAARKYRDLAIKKYASKETGVDSDSKKAE